MHPAADALGNFYEEGRGGLNKSAGQAAKLYLRAAAKYPKAQYDLGRLADTGFADHPPDHEKALTFYRMAAQEGYEPAQHVLYVLGLTDQP